MCGRFVLQTDTRGIVERFGVSPSSDVELEPGYNVAPSQQIPIIVGTADGPRLGMATWGFRPSWMSNGGHRPPPINARSEGILERPLFRSSLPRHRCIIPADGFFEWQAVGRSKRKQPWFFRLKTGELFGFAGLYSGELGSSQEHTCVIITTSPNGLVAPVHNRMPVILAPDDEPRWLDPTLTDPHAVTTCLRPYSAEQMEGYAVSPAVNSAANNSPQLLLPLE